jgi:S-adenosylmethionine:tRNA ribosyltransferase-isomerase
MQDAGCMVKDYVRFVHLAPCILHHATLTMMKDINILDFDYDLPDDRIAQYPVSERDESQLLVYRGQSISQDTFKNIDGYLPSGSLLVFNNTRVIRARMLFRKETGALIEILCLEPLLPFDYSLSFSSKVAVEWKCIVGNLKKWKEGKLMIRFIMNGNGFHLWAERLETTGETSRIRFTWDSSDICFGEVLEATGHIPLPPYINRDDETEDSKRYQTIYSKINGSVAAPTAGLHFTQNVLEKIRDKGLKTAELTLHVGAGTFQPIKADNIFAHEMHCEHFIIKAETLKMLLEYEGKIIAVGTTSVRTLESIYWLGVKLLQNMGGYDEELILGQWDAYNIESTYTVKDSINALLDYLCEMKSVFLRAATSIMIVPGYEFRLTSGIVTNFHQPRSTLLLLISAWTGEQWRDIYKFAIEKGFRFLSYGDSSLLLK